MLNHETHEINKITFRRIFFLKSFFVYFVIFLVKKIKEKDD